MAVYYNEIDPYAAQWLRNLIAAGHIADGDVDERSIVDVRSDDLRGYRQCHFFAGIGVWSYALRLAGWPDDREIWTGSCPCQPFSSARNATYKGNARGLDLWPTWSQIIASVRPRAVIGEQVAHGSEWIDRVSDDMEAIGYDTGAAYLQAFSVGADHARPRVYFVCHPNGDREPSIASNATDTSWMQRNRGQSRGMGAKDGPPDRMACLRAFGNAIHAEVARRFIEAYMEIAP